MGAEWLETTIGDQATLQRGIDITKAAQRAGRVPVISSGGISSYHDKAQVRGPGVVLGRKGVVGSVYYVESDYWPHDTTLWVKDFHGNEPRFVYYFFKQMAPQLSRMDVGSANPTLNRNHVHPIVVFWPPLPKQRAIAHILGTIDDKIELNRKMNETLEAMARAIFKSWFVDFDPVRAKVEGRDPGLPKEIADLFPDSIEDSELGKIPRGWHISSLGTIAKIEYGNTLPQDELLESGCPVYGAAGIIGCYDKAMFSEPVTLVTSRGSYSGTVHETWEPAYVTNNSFSVTHRESWFSRHYLREYLKWSDILSYVTGSAQPQLTIKNFSNLPILVPDAKVLTIFNACAERLWEFQKCNREQSRTLTAIRVALMPKLISGELRLKDVERFVPEATI